jgi:RND family efflux transporter MFP subunit
MNVHGRPIGRYLVLAALALAPAAGCGKAPVTLAPTKPSEVVVDRPVIRPFVDHEEFTGRTEAFNTVDIRSQVSGYLDSVHFKDGADVPEGALLFRIDPQTYTAALDQAKSALTQAKAHLDRLTRDHERMIKLKGTTALSQEEFDRVVGDREEAGAAVKVAEAAKRLAETNLAYTEIRAKFAGRLSRRMIDPGNVVKANETLLTNLVALDPIYAAFDVDERTLLRIRRLVREGKITSARNDEVRVEIGLADEEGYHHSAPITFVDSRVDAASGTLRVRATLPNPKILFSPGLFLRIRLPVGKPKPALMVPEEAIGSDQGQRFVYVVNDKDEVEYRKVKPGPLTELARGDGPAEQVRVIEEGVSPADRVIVSGLQRVRAGVKVAPKERAPAPPAGNPLKLPDTIGAAQPPASPNTVSLPLVPNPTGKP